MSKIIAELEVRDTKVAAAAKGVRDKINKALGGVGGRSGSMLAAVGVGARLAGAGVAVMGAAALAAGAGVARAVNSAMDFGGKMADLEARTGIAAGDLVVLSRAFELAGVSAEGVGPAVARLQKALAGVNEDGEPTNEMISRLGLNLAELEGMTPDAQFRKVGAAIAGLSSPTERAAAAIGIFGRSGAELLSLFRDSSTFTEAANQVGKQAEILNRNAGIFDGVSDKLESSGLKLRGFAVGAADYLAPALAPLAEMIAGGDLAEAGQRFGKNLATYAFMATDSVKTLADYARSAADGIGEKISSLVRLASSLPGLGGLMDSLTGSSAAKGVKDVLSVALGDYDAAWARAGAKVEALHSAAQAKEGDARKNRMQEAAAGGGLLDGEEGNGRLGAPRGQPLTISRMFSTSMGLMVKQEPLLAENQRQSKLLETIAKNTAGGSRAGGEAIKGGTLRFT
jgi:hypothetical protein